MQHQIQKTRYSHQALADMLLTCPDLTQKELAVIFDKTPVWVSYVINSDAFQVYLSERRKLLVDPVLTLTIEDRLKGLCVASTDILMEKLAAGGSADLACKALELSTKALGYGARAGAQAVVNNNFVVAMPGKAASAGEWVAGYKGGALEAGGPASE